MSVDKRHQIGVKLAVEVPVGIVRCASVQLMHQFVNLGEKVEIADSLLCHCSLEYQCPNLLIVPLYVVKLPSQVKESSLIVTNFLFPELDDDILEV